MTAPVLIALEPRKTPVQARATATVEAIFEAAIQVLLSHGADRLTTTRVAERAGVSVGTLYQYFPNKQALLYAVFEDHMKRVSVAVEQACRQAHHKPLAEMMRHIVEAYIDAKMARADISIALYKVAADVGGAAVVKRAVQCSRKAIEAALETAPGVELSPDRYAIEMMLAAVSGVMRSALESAPSPATARKMKEHLVLLCQSYMAAALTHKGAHRA
jgi:AcrR family transcriptional regulator